VVRRRQAEIVCGLADLMVISSRFGNENMHGVLAAAAEPESRR
jgi:hypothetical protein